MLKDFLNKVILGDCLEVMKKIEDKSIDMILCDLPYGTTQNKWDSVIPLDKLWEEYKRILKPNGVVALTSHGIFTAKLILSNEKWFKYKIVWEKSKATNFLNAKKQPLRKHEDICIFYNKQPKYNPQMSEGEPYDKGVRKNQLTGSYGIFNPIHVKSEGMRYPTDIVYFKTAESEGEVYHSTQKPVELARYLIRTYTEENDIILDNTCGSGSFLVAAVLEKRNFIGIEKNEDIHLYKNKKIDLIEICNKRIMEAYEKMEMGEVNNEKIGITLENERSWGIELISLINSYAEKDEKSLIKFASGEVSLTTNKGSLFPDVLLFGDKIKTKILQGWELKFPNTKIDNKDLIENAEKKARLLGVNSFFIWNVSKARLYVENEKKEFKLLKEWDSLSHITSREEVGKFMHEIKEELYKILKDLNFFFENDILKSEKILTSISSDYLYSSLFRHLNDYSRSLKKACQKDSELNDDISLWWEIEGKTYGEKTNKWNETSKLAITSLINKFIFVNILKKYNKKAKIIEELDENSSIEKCLEKFETISKQCDFYNIFEEKLGEKYIDENSLKNILEFNSYLLNLDFTNYDNSLLEMIMAQVVTRNTRKVSGQFATPRELAIFLSTLTLQDKTSKVLDPCCGTGTILKAVYDLKKYHGISIQENLKNIWAGDKFRYPLQFAMLALTNPENIGIQINIFKSDVFDLDENKNIQLHDVNSKDILEVKCGKYEVIISNLPFVQQESLKNKDIYKKINLDNKRSDLYAYILLKLEELLAKNGKIGVIISNSWLGTEFGDKFYNRLIEKYNIEYIITSGRGRWFKNADVVTNLVILSNNKGNNNTRFVTLNKKIEELIGNENTDNQCENASNLVAKIRKNIITKEFIQNNYSEKEIEDLMKLGMIRNSLFTNCKWLLNLQTLLIPITKYFEIKRGERRGCNELFYPKNHTIEKEYISPVIKNLKKSSYLINSEDFIDGFTCSKSQEELKNLGHINALEWIKKFDGLKDSNGKTYNEKLKKKGYYWYEMTLNNLYDIALLVNPNERLFFAKVMTPVFFDQRLIGLTRKDKIENLDLLIALLNSILGIFYIEAIGFGRGLGVLDLSKDKFEDNFKMLNPKLISEQNKNKILEAYKLLEKREIKKLTLELNEVDRIKFDKIVLESFGLSNYYEVIKNSLLELFKIRMSATEE